MARKNKARRLLAELAVITDRNLLPKGKRAVSIYQGGKTRHRLYGNNSAHMVGIGSNVRKKSI